MIRYEDNCVGCPPEMGCLGGACPNKNVPVFNCDKCEAELGEDELYNVEGRMLCSECVLKKFKAEAGDFV